MAWLERYRDGDCEAVWDELHALGSAGFLGFTFGTAAQRPEQDILDLTRDLLPI